MWGIAHSQGIRLPTKDYWEFRDMITVSPRRARSFDGYLQLFHWTELIQSSPLAVERAVYEVVGGAYRAQQRDDHGAALQPHEAQPGRRAGPRPHHQRRDPGHGPRQAGVPGHAGPHPVPRPRLPVPAQRDHRREGHRVPAARASWASTSPVPNRRTFRPAEYKRLFERARRKGLGITVHTGESGPVEEVGEVIRQLEPSRIGHGVKAALRPAHAWT